MSLAFLDGQPIPDKYSCNGDNINPPFELSDVPAEAQSLVLVMDDPDALPDTFVHWAVWNIGRETTRIDEGLPPPLAIEGTNSAGTTGYVGPCPPSGQHRYHFKLYALDRELDLNAHAGKHELEEAMVGRILEQAEIVGLYGQP